MAGHSKWANIQHRKGAQDAKRAQIFTRLIREVTVAARTGGDPAANPRLRLAVSKALAANVTRDAIDRAIGRSVGGLDGADLDEVRYEGYGPGGVAVLVDTLTNNRNRTASNVRYAFTRHGGNLGTEGSVAYLFAKKGVLHLPPEVDEAQLTALALEADAEDVQRAPEGHWALLTAPAALEATRARLEAHGVLVIEAAVNWLAGTQVSLEGDKREQALALLEALESLDDVQAVYSNLAD